jgi:hypothetical protein
MESPKQTLNVSINNDGYATIEKKENRGPILFQPDRSLLAKQH